MAGRGLDRLALARRGPVAQAVVRRAEVGPALDHPTRDVGARLAAAVALLRPVDDSSMRPGPTPTRCGCRRGRRDGAACGRRASLARAASDPRPDSPPGRAVARRRCCSRRLAGRSSGRCPPLLTPGKTARRLHTVRMARRRRRTVSGPVAIRQDRVGSFDRFESTRVDGPGEPIARKANDLRTPPAPDQPLKPVVEIPSTSRRWKAMKNPTIGSRDSSDMASVCPQELRLVASMNALRATGTV